MNCSLAEQFTELEYSTLAKILHYAILADVTTLYLKKIPRLYFAINQR